MRLFAKGFPKMGIGLRWLRLNWRVSCLRDTLLLGRISETPVKQHSEYIIQFPVRIPTEHLALNRFLLGLNGAAVLYYFFVHEMALLVEALNILLNGI